MNYLTEELPSEALQEKIVRKPHKDASALPSRSPRHEF